MREPAGRSVETRSFAKTFARVIAACSFVLLAACGGGDDADAVPVVYGAEDLRSGAPADLADLRGSVVLLSGWATWCAPCREELPLLDELHAQRQRDGLVVVTVNLDPAGPSVRSVLPYLDAIGVTAPAWIDTDNDFAFVFEAVTMPTNVLLDRDGRVVRIWNGAIEFDDEFDAIIDAALTA